VLARRGISFLFLTSLHSGTPRNLPHYSTSKAALAMLVKELAKALGLSLTNWFEPPAIGEL
jgi:3-oxoacyl-[acyl-carrier protein] reductase